MGYRVFLYSISAGFFMHTHNLQRIDMLNTFKALKIIICGINRAMLLEGHRCQMRIRT